MSSRSESQGASPITCPTSGCAATATATAPPIEKPISVISRAPPLAATASAAAASSMQGPMFRQLRMR